MRPIPFEQGRVVLSLQGRDKGRCFIVLSALDDEFVLMADGDLRKVQRPKRKKKKHLHVKPAFFPEIAEKLQAGAPVLDSELRKALAQAAKQQELHTRKEGCGFVKE